MKQIAFIFVIVGLFSSCGTNKHVFKSTNLEMDMFPYCENGLWGYNNKEGNTVIAPQYEEAYLLNYGLARVKMKGKYGFISEDGKQMLKCKYDEASDFQIGKLGARPFWISTIKHKDEMGHIDRHGKKVVNGDEELMDMMKGDKPIEVEHPLFKRIVSDGEKYELAYSYLVENENGTSLNNADTTSFSIDTFFMVNSKVLACRSNGKFGIVFLSQLKGIPADKTPYKEYVYKEGAYTPQIEFVYDDLAVINNTRNYNSHFYLAANLDDQWGVINLGGNQILPCHYISIKHIEKRGYVLVEFEENKLGYVSMHSEYDENRKTIYSYTEHFRR